MATISANIELVEETLDHASTTHCHELANSLANVLRFHHYTIVEEQRQIRSWLKYKAHQALFGLLKSDCQFEIATYCSGNRACPCVRDAHGHHFLRLLQPFF